MIRRIISNSHRIPRRKSLRQTQTLEESIIWNIVRNSKLGVRFRRQVSIGSYIVDFYCPEKKLIIEIDGSQHLDNKQYDKEREDYLLSLGMKTIRFWNNEINQNIDGVYMRIINIINN